MHFKFGVRCYWMTTIHPVLAEFQQRCQQHYTCCALAIGGVNNFVNELGNRRPDKLVFKYVEKPRQESLVARVTVADLRILGAPDGQFSDTLAKAVLVYVYAEWEEHYRIKYAKSIGTNKGSVCCDLMGDLRRVRNCIVHAQSIVTNEHERRTVMQWPKCSGNLKITFQMMTQFFSQVTHLEVVLKKSQGGD